MWQKILYWLEARKLPSGLNILVDDIRDLDWRDFFDEKTYTPLASIKKLDPIFIKDQKRNSNCSFQAWSNVYAVFFGENISARYLVAKAWQQGWCDKGGAAIIRTGAKIGQQYGVCSETECPSDETLPWDEYVNVDFAALDLKSSARKIGSYYRIKSTNDLLQAIDKGYAVALGRTWLTSMNQSGGFCAPWVLKRIGLTVGGHSTAAVGYSQITKTDIEANSYSSLWGDKGFFYCNQSELQADIDKYGAFTITAIPYTPKEVKDKLIRQIFQALLKRKDMTKNEQLAKMATDRLGTDFTNDYVVPDRVSCAYAVTTLLHQVDPEIPINPSTYELWRYLQKSPKFFRVYDPEPGDVVISPTGTSSKLTNGHTGIYLDNNRIASNSSMPETLGLWINNYNRLSWRHYFHDYGLFRVYLFRLI